VYAWPHVTVPEVVGTRTVSPVGFVAGCRARAHAGAGVWQSPILARFGSAQYASAAEVQSGDTEFLTLNTAGVSVIRKVNGTLRLYGWKTVESVDGDTAGSLQGAQFRDLTNFIAAECNTIAETFVGQIVDGKGLRLGEFAGALTGMLSNLAAAGALFARVDDNGNEVDPGYVVDAGSNVNSPASLAAGNLKAEVGVRLSPTAEFVTISVTAGDAAAGL
jgi:phage tail sheath protein FI